MPTKKQNKNKQNSRKRISKKKRISRKNLRGGGNANVNYSNLNLQNVTGEFFNLNNNNITGSANQDKSQQEPYNTTWRSWFKKAQTGFKQQYIPKYTAPRDPLTVPFTTNANNANNTVVVHNFSNLTEELLSLNSDLKKIVESKPEFIKFSLYKSDVDYKDLLIAYAEAFSINTSIKELILYYLVNNQIITILNSLIKHTLISLTIVDCDFSIEDNLKSLSNLIKNNNSITSLTLSNNKIGNKSELIFDALKSNTTLKFIDLTNNPLKSKSIEYIANFILSNTPLTTLILKNCQLYDNDNDNDKHEIHHIISQLNKNTNLTILDLSYNNITMSDLTFSLEYIDRYITGNEYHLLKLYFTNYVCGENPYPLIDKIVLGETLNNILTLYKQDKIVFYQKCNDRLYNFEMHHKDLQDQQIFNPIYARINARRRASEEAATRKYRQQRALALAQQSQPKTITQALQSNIPLGKISLPIAKLNIPISQIEISNITESSDTPITIGEALTFLEFKATDVDKNSKILPFDLITVMNKIKKISFEYHPDREKLLKENNKITNNKERQDNLLSRQSRVSSRKFIQTVQNLKQLFIDYFAQFENII